MDCNTCKSHIKADFQRVISRVGLGISGYNLVCYIRDNTLRLVFWFRIGSYLYTCKSLFWKAIYVLMWVNYRHLQHKLGIQLPLGTQIGGGLRFLHYGSIVIAQSSVIGKNATIHQDVTLGKAFWGKNIGCPEFGNGVFIYAGSKIIGKVSIANNVIIGANSVVNKSFPDKSVIAVVSAKIISTDSSQYFDNFWRSAFCQI